MVLYLFCDLKSIKIFSFLANATELNLEAALIKEKRIF